MSPEFVVRSHESSADRILEVGAGDYVFQEGELGTEMFIIQDGRVEIFQTIGSQERQLATLEKGDFFGEMAILDGAPRAASVRALTDLKLLRIDGTESSHRICRAIEFVEFGCVFSARSTIESEVSDKLGRGGPRLTEGVWNGTLHS